VRTSTLPLRKSGFTQKEGCREIRAGEKVGKERKLLGLGEGMTRNQPIPKKGGGQHKVVL